MKSRLIQVTVYVFICFCFSCKENEEIGLSNYIEVFPDTKREWQGIPTIEYFDDNIYVAWYSGGVDEGPENFVTLYRGDLSSGKWERDLKIIDPPGFIRAFDPVLWSDDKGKLFLFWNQSEGLWDGRGGVWSSFSLDPSSSDNSWSRPKRIADGVMIQKPIYSGGGLFLPIAIWFFTLPNNQMAGSFIHRVDQFFNLINLTEVPLDRSLRSFDEHTILKISDSVYRVYIRTKEGIHYSVSSDKGSSWSKAQKDLTIGLSADSKFFISRLNSGRYILIKNNSNEREKLTAYLSEDSNLCWEYSLEIDKRFGVSYPDLAENEAGELFLVYDRNRYTDKEIIIAKFKEEDIISSNIENVKYYILR